MTFFKGWNTMRNRQWLRYLGLIVFIAALLALGACDSMPESAKPDVHLTFDIHADGSNSVALEIAVHPLLDPLLRPALAEAQRLLEGNVGESVKLTQTKRAGREYSALLMEFQSMADLTAFMNTPQLLSGIAAQVAPDLTVPSLFSEFNAWYDPETRPSEYGLRARIDPAGTTALSIVKLTAHVVMPYEVRENNAANVIERTLSWEMVSGQPLEIHVVANRPFSVGGSAALRPLLIGLAMVTLIAMAVAVGYWLYRRSQYADQQGSSSSGFDDW